MRIISYLISLRLNKYMCTWLYMCSRYLLNEWMNVPLLGTPPLPHLQSANLYLSFKTRLQPPEFPNNDFCVPLPCFHSSSAYLSHTVITNVLVSLPSHILVNSLGYRSCFNWLCICSNYCGSWQIASTISISVEWLLCTQLTKCLYHKLY